MNSYAGDLVDLMLRAEQICAAAEKISGDIATALERDELKLKISQARNGVARLQSKFDADELVIGDNSVQAEFRLLVVNLLWTVFYARHHIERSTYRSLVAVEFSLTGLLTGDPGFRQPTV